MQTVEISVVIPVFNEASVLEQVLAELRNTLEGGGTNYEIIVVNDGSTDKTEKILHREAAKFDNIIAINLSRNFGKESALSAGISFSRGACIVFMDADLQHPPSLIPNMFEKWKEGYDVVNAKKAARGREKLSYRLYAHLFNWFMSKAIGTDFSGASDFKLIDRQVAKALISCPERNRFFRGLVSWVGFRSTHIDFDVHERQAGLTKWSMGKLLRYSLKNFIAFSSLPLKIVAYMGFMMAGLGLVLLIQTLLNYLIGNAAIGFTTVIAVQILLGGMIISSLGVIAIYIANIYDEQKARPLFIVRNERITDKKKYRTPRESGDPWELDS